MVNTEFSDVLVAQNAVFWSGLLAVCLETFKGNSFIFIRQIKNLVVPPLPLLSATAAQVRKDMLIFITVHSVCDLVTCSGMSGNHTDIEEDVYCFNWE